MSGKIEISRELAERVLAKLEQADYSWNVNDPEQELRALLAAPVVECATPCGEKCPGDGVSECKKCPSITAPVVERQEPVAYATFDAMRKLAEDSCNELIRRAIEHKDQLDKLHASPPAPVAVVLPTREEMADLVGETIGGDTYDCTRVWSAWGVGTMSEDDFVPISQERLYEMADAYINRLKELNQ